MEKIDRIINQRLKKGEFKTSFKAAMVCVIAQKIIPSCRVVSFSDGLIKVWVKDYATGNQIVINQINYIREINKELKFDKVKMIKVSVKNYT